MLTHLLRCGSVLWMAVVLVSSVRRLRKRRDYAPTPNNLSRAGATCSREVHGRRMGGAWEPRPGIGATALTQRTQAATRMREKRSWAGRAACGRVGARGPGRSAIAARPAAPRRPAAGPTPTPCEGRSAPSARCAAGCRRRGSPPRRHRPRPGPRVRVRVRVRARVRARGRARVRV